MLAAGAASTARLNVQIRTFDNETPATVLIQALVIVVQGADGGSAWQNPPQKASVTQLKVADFDKWPAVFETYEGRRTRR